MFLIKKEYKKKCFKDLEVEKRHTYIYIYIYMNMIFNGPSISEKICVQYNSLMHADNLESKS